METKEFAASMANGSATYMDRDEAMGDICGMSIPNSKEILLKNIIKGIDTDGMLSCHMVRIDPNTILEDDFHENQWELHEVIEGEGKFVLEWSCPYQTGHPSNLLSSLLMLTR